MMTVLFGLGVMLLTLPALALVAMMAMACAAVVWFLVVMNISIVGHLVLCISQEKGESMIQWANKELVKW
jgi:hypothetical protein